MYDIIPIESIFIKREVLKKLLNGLITNSIIIIIDVAVQRQIFFVSFVKIDRFNGLLFVSIYYVDILIYKLFYLYIIYYIMDKQVQTFMGIMSFYIVLTYIIFPLGFYYLAGKTLASAGNGFVVGSIVSVILWYNFGKKMIETK
jgi:hypothetical protein